MRGIVFGIVAVVIVCAAPPSCLASVPRAISYQGKLLDTAGQPVDGAHNLTFRLFDQPTGGTPGWTETLGSVPVSGGLLTLAIGLTTPIPDSILGGDLYLEVEVDGTTLSPRQRIVSSAFAMRAGTVDEVSWSALTGVPAGFADGIDNDTLYAAGAGLNLSGNVFSLDTSYTSGLYWSLSGNGGTIPGTNFLGTTDNQAFEIKVNSSRALRLEPATSSPNIIIGSSSNAITAGVYGGTIGGGGTAGYANLVTDNGGVVGGGMSNRAGDNASPPYNAPWATVSGGGYNVASARASTVGGGDSNAASGVYATVGGGAANTAAYDNSTVAGGSGNQATALGTVVSGGISNQASTVGSLVAGGNLNVASGGYSSIGGGQSNTASGNYSAVLGGYQCTAQGYYSLAAGRRAKALYDGTFVWADTQYDADFTSTGYNQFLVRAWGGVGINVNDPQTAFDVYGVIRSRFGGFQFPDGTTQTTAATGVSLPYAGSTTSAGSAFSVTNNGSGPAVSATGAYAGEFQGNVYVNGNLGVGDASPSYPLDVAGVVRSSSGGFQFPDGTVQTTAATSGLSLPYSGGAATAGDAFSITNASSGNVAVFESTSNSSVKSAVVARNSGWGPAIHARHTGGANAATFEVDSPSQSGAAVSASINGGGVAVDAYANSASGMAGYFRNTNASNANHVLQASTVGSGHVIRASTVGGGHAVYGSCSGAWTTGSAVYGEIASAAANASAVLGRITSKTPGGYSAGVRGINDGAGGSGVGVYGSHAAGGWGVFGATVTGSGVRGYASGNGNAIDGYISGTGYAGIFSGGLLGNGVSISTAAGKTGLTVSGGTKNAVVPTSSGDRLLYTEESTEVWFTDYGFGKLTDGCVTIKIDPLFAETVALDAPYHVFLQLEDPGCEGVAVVNKKSSGFDVVELRHGKSDAEFSYRIVAKRKDYVTARLERAPSSNAVAIGR